MNTNNLPRWNLDSIFKSLQAPEYLEAVQKYKTLIKTALNLIVQMEDSKIEFDPWLCSYLETENELLTYANTLNAYAYIIYSTDTTNTYYLNNISNIESISLSIKEINSRFGSLLFKNQDKLKDFLKNNKEYKDYEYVLLETLEETKHLMSVECENLAGELQRTGGNAWERLHEQLISNLSDENGKTFNELRNDAYSCNEELRRESWKKEVELLNQNKIAFAACLNNLKGETVSLNHRRNWNSAIDRSLFASRLSKETLTALIQAIEESLPLWREYFQAKALFLRKTGKTVSKTAGTLEHKGIAFYDLFAPIEGIAEDHEEESIVSKKWTFNEAKEYIIKEYSSFSKEMGDFAKKAFDNYWIDAEVRPGKVGGAYDEDFALVHESRILTNFTGAFSDIITLAHECGHAYHFSCMKGKPSMFFSYPMTLAETASTFAETIVKQDAIKSCKSNDKFKIIELELQDTAQVLVDILSRFYFESSVFQEREKGELNGDDFCRLMMEAQEKSYGDGLNDEKSENGEYTERHNYMWAVKSHYYSTELDFYNFPYAFGQLFAASLYEKSLKEGAEFSKKYAKLLSKTGSMSCEALCLEEGFDITSKEFWKEGIRMYEKEIKEFSDFVRNYKVQA